MASLEKKEVQWQMNYAIIETGSKQYKVQVGDVIYVEKLPVEVGTDYCFDHVLALSQEGQMVIGNPLVNGATVSAKVEEQGKEKKISGFRYKAKSNYRRRYGHRQPFTKLTIVSIQA
jgi:large subunit ribosomal protein L21